MACRAPGLPYERRSGERDRQPNFVSDTVRDSLIVLRFFAFKSRAHTAAGPAPNGPRNLTSSEFNDKNRSVTSAYRAHSRGQQEFAWGTSEDDVIPKAAGSRRGA